VGVATELLLLGFLVYVPALQDVFHTAPLGLREWAFALAWTPVVIVLDEGRKALLRGRKAEASRQPLSPKGRSVMLCYRLPTVP
jgi:P-type Ca2+ transporter type 2C